jgi:7,8-dihydropterin-6-yl-methyl-4-(beta-D-ribofuranosyl)aminobenzene 5'-phosphate synthase
VKITALAENSSARPDLGSEHGLSLFIETADIRLLFDMGQSGLFAENARKLGVDLTSAELAVLSHGHYDHGGGLPVFLEISRQAPVYLSCYAFDECHNAEGKYIGLDPALKTEPRLRFTGEERELSPSLHLYSCNERERKHPLDSAGLTVMREGELRPDSFRHEQYLLIEERGKRVLISGCSHKGVLNLLEWFRPDVLVGGFHLMKQPADEALAPWAESLGTCTARLYTCHCTGLEQYRWLKSRLPALGYLSTGQTIEI